MEKNWQTEFFGSSAKKKRAGLMRVYPSEPAKVLAMPSIVSFESELSCSAFENDPNRSVDIESGH